MGGEKRTLSIGITGEFITQIAREWFYSGEKSIEKIMEILVGSTTGSLVRDMTKAQKEFLYDYYTERDCKKEANEVWKE